MIFTSFAILFTCAMNLGGEYRFLANSAAGLTSLSAALPPPRIMYYGGVAVLGVFLTALFGGHLIAQHPLFSTAALICYFLSQIVFNHLSFLLVARHRNHRLLLINLIGAVTMVVPLWLVNNLQLPVVLMTMAGSAFIKVSLLSYDLWSNPVDCVRAPLEARNDTDRIFVRRYFVASIGTPIGYLIAFFSNSAIAIHHSTAETVAILLSYRVLNQALTFSTAIVSPIFYRYAVAERRDLGAAFKWLLPAGGVSIALPYVFVVVMPPGQWAIAKIFLTVSVEHATYILFWLLPALLGGMVTGVFFHSFVAIGGVAARNALLGIRLLLVFAICGLGLAGVKIRVFEALVVIDTLIAGAYAVLLLRRISSPAQ